MNKKQLISQYIASQILGVIATVNQDNNPQAALVALTEVDTLGLIFGTYNTSRKYRNILKNPHIAVVFGNSPEEAITVQYEGIAEELSGVELERCRTLHIAKNPRSAKYADKPEQRYFKIKPTWIRYVDLASNPNIEFEVTEFH